MEVPLSKRRWMVVVSLAALTITATLLVEGPASGNPVGYGQHVPIRIDGDQDLGPFNGVTKGHGTAGDPYVIEGWEIDPSLYPWGVPSLHIGNTTAYIVVQDIDVHAGDIRHRALDLVNVRNVRIQRIYMSHVALGIAVDGGSNINISRVFSEDMLGPPISVWRSTEVSIYANRMWNNSGPGIEFALVTNAVISFNTIAFAQIGVSLHHSAGILVHHNTFALSTVAALGSDDGANAWDDGYPSGGNAWWNYSGEDRCTGPNQDVCPKRDGIGDTPHVFEPGLVDRYPLMRAVNPAGSRPNATFQAIPSSGEINRTIRLDASSSWDPDDPYRVLSIEWDFDGDGHWDTFASRVRTAETSYARAGTYTVRLRVTDPSGLSNTSFQQVTVTDPSAGPPPQTPLVVYATAAVLAVGIVLGAALFLRRRRRRSPGRPPENP